LSLPAFTSTASMPKVDDQLKLPGVPDDDWVKLVIVIVPKPATVIVSLPGGSDLASSQVCPPPWLTAKSAQVGLELLLIGTGVTDAAWTVAPGANSATDMSESTISHENRRARRERERWTRDMRWTPHFGRA
jgi:hypothetical protein